MMFEPAIPQWVKTSVDERASERASEFVTKQIKSTHQISSFLSSMELYKINKAKKNSLQSCYFIASEVPQ
jgi:hypothetical protein